MSVLPSNGSPPSRGAELETLAARSLGAGAEAGERIAARRAFKALEALLAGSVDLAAVEGAAVLFVADDLVGLVQRGKRSFALASFGFWSG